jgi:Ca2+-binding RTX toxin-like protein
MSIGFDARRDAVRSLAVQPKPTLQLLLCVGLALSACAPAPAAESEKPRSVDDFPGTAQASFALLETTCTVTSAGIAVTVDAGETALVSLSAMTGNLTVNANQASGSPCEGAPTLAVTITAGTAGDHGVFLNLTNGIFSKATSNSPKVRINLGSGSSDTLTVQGSAYADHLYFGKGTTANTYFLNLNGGAGSGDDAFSDVALVGVEHVVVNGGAGNDIIDGTGLFGTTAPYPAALTLNGGPDDDTLNGGAGDDVLSGDAGSDYLNGGKGANTYASGTANDGTDVITVAASAVDTVDYSQRFNSVSVSLDSSATSGETGEHDSIPDTVSVVLGGSGNDAISALGSTRNHTLMGGPGNDTLTGGSGLDTLLGGDGVAQVDGDDLFIGSKATVNYSGRSQPLTITVNSAGHGGANANDGDPAGTRSVQAAVPALVGATISAATNVVTGLVNMNAGSVGRVLTIAGSLHDDGSYRIATVRSASSVVLRASDTGANAAWADDTAAAWTFAEDAGAEKDEVRCKNVIGSGTAANTITGDSNDNLLTGGSASDTLIGGAGNDTLAGLEGNDSLYGGAGDDTLIGGPNNDHLYGGDGNDLLEGDGDADAFGCDGNNAPGVPGSAPGNADFTVDYSPGAGGEFDTLAVPLDCEF